MLWLAFGNIGVLLTAALISKEPPWTFSPRDVVFWALVVVMIVGRYLDITRYRGLTANNEPANLGHWVRYAVGVLVIASLLWAGAQSVQL